MTTSSNLFDGVPHQQTPLDQLQVGDYIEYQQNGVRCGKVEEIFHKHGYVMCSKRCIPKNFKIILIHVLRVWRKCDGESEA